MHVCAIPQQPTSRAGPPSPSPTWPASWRRWSPKKSSSAKVAVAAPSSGGGNVVRRKKRSPVTISMTRRRYKKSAPRTVARKHTSTDVEIDETLVMANTRFSEDAPLLEIDEKTPCTVEISHSRPTRSSRCRIRRLLRLNRHRSVSGAGGDSSSSSTSSTRLKRKREAAAENHEKVYTKETVGPNQGWAYYLAIGLAWYMPAPFDLMPQGYPSRAS